MLFTETKKSLGLVKSEFATVTRLDRLTQKVTVQIDGQEKAVTFSLEKFNALRLGYACTVHRSQGTTVEHTFILFGGAHAEPRDDLRAALEGARRVPPLYRQAIGAEPLGFGALGASLRREIGGPHD